MNIDMTIGKPWRLLARFAVPILLSSLFQQLYNSIDAMIVGKMIGPGALAATGISSSVIFLVNSLLLGLSIGASVVVAQLTGAKDKKRVSLSITTNMLIALLLSLVLTIIGQLGAVPMLHLLNTPADVFDQAEIYARTILGGLIFTVFYNQVSGILRGMGNSRTPLYFLIFCSLLNIVLDYTFVRFCGFGIRSVAIATIISQGVSSVLCLYYLFRRTELIINLRGRLFDGKLAQTILRLSIPSAIQQSAIAIGLLVMQGIIDSFDTYVITAFTAASRIDMFAVMPLVAAGSALAVYCGQNIGAGNLERVRQGYRSANLIVIAISLALAALIVPCRFQLMRLFIDATTNQQAFIIGTQYLTILPLFYWLLGFTNSTYGVLNGAGDATFVMISTVLMMIFRVITAYILAFTCSLGYLGVWWSWPASWFLVMLLTFIRYKSNAWSHLPKANHAYS